MYKDDFNLEREDRQKAHSKMAEMDSDFSRELQLLENELHRSKTKVEVQTVQCHLLFLYQHWH